MKKLVLKEPVRMFALFLVIMTCSCAVRTPVKQISISEVKETLKYKNIIFRNFDSALNIDNSTVSSAIVMCKDTAMSHLNAKNIFKRILDSVENSYEEPTLFVDATVTDLRIVSSAARVWGGVLPGRSHMKVLVKLTDSSTGELIAEKELFGAPNVYGSAYSAGTADSSLPSNMGILLGDYILGNVSYK